MRAGRNRFEVILERRTDSQQDSGQVVFDYTPFGSDFASIEDLIGREFVASTQVQADATTRIRMRWRDDVDETCRVRHVKQDESPPVEDIYDVIAPPMSDMKTGRRELILMCSKRRADGWRREPG